MFQNGSSAGGGSSLSRRFSQEMREVLVGASRSPGEFLLEEKSPQEISYRNFDIPGQLRREYTDDNLGMQRDDRLPYVLEPVKEFGSSLSPNHPQGIFGRKWRVAATHIPPTHPR
jgi:hypothetical protein